jgi:glycoprotein endo-alpha-1,2-mannosidase
MALTRRAFLAGLLASGTAVRAERRVPAAGELSSALGFPDGRREWHGDSSVGAQQRGRVPIRGRDPDDRLRTPIVQPGTRLDWARAGETLRRRCPDLKRHFLFEYYAWYETIPWRHWNEADRRPPDDIASNYMPLLGPYDSGSQAVIERHARWIADAGAGAISLSWWGPGSRPDQLVPLIMDVMRDHGIHVAFHLEPYADQHGRTYASDVLYLLKQYGERRRWDNLLLLENADGKVGPVFKSFRTLLTPEVTDCHGIVYPVPDYTDDGRWRQQTDFLRRELGADFDHITVLADSLDVARTTSAGFDGIAIYDNYVRPDTWRSVAGWCKDAGLVFSFNINPGFDGVALRSWDPESCYRPPRFEPDDGALDWSSARARDQARQLSEGRILESAETTLALQTDSALSNSVKGFFLVYINSFNEWHEGHQLEPMKDYAALSPAERPVGYRNPHAGTYRLDYLRALLGRLKQAVSPVAEARRLA